MHLSIDCGIALVAIILALPSRLPGQTAGCEIVWWQRGFRARWSVSNRPG